jgi:hypothetical protein
LRKAVNNFVKSLKDETFAQTFCREMSQALLKPLAEDHSVDVNFSRFSQMVALLTETLSGHLSSSIQLSRAQKHADYLQLVIGSFPYCYSGNSRELSSMAEGMLCVLLENLATAVNFKKLVAKTLQGCFTLDNWKAGVFADETTEEYQQLQQNLLRFTDVETMVLTTIVNGCEVGQAKADAQQQLDWVDDDRKGIIRAHKERLMTIQANANTDMTAVAAYQATIRDHPHTASQTQVVTLATTVASVAATAQ